MGLKVGRALVAEGRVKTMAVVKHFDVLKHIRSGLIPRRISLLMDQLDLERGKEGKALYRRRRNPSATAVNGSIAVIPIPQSPQA